MNPLGRGALGALLSVLLGLGAASAQAQDDEDTIRKKDNTSVTGKIKSEDIKACVVVVGKAELTVPWSVVKSVDYGGSQQFRDAKLAADAGNTQDAIARLEKLKGEGDLRTLLKPHVLNLLGSSYMRAGNYEKAIESYNALFKSYPKSQFLQSAGENLVNCYIAKKQPEQAKKVLDELKDAGVDLTPLNLLRARVLEATGDFAGAQAAYNQVLSSATDDFTKAAADLGIGRCLLGQKQASQAETKFKAIVSKDPAPHHLVLAGAWNGLGEVLYQQGFDAKDPEKLTAALYNFLRGCVLYVPQSGEPTEELEHALAGSAKSFRAIAEIEQKADKKKLFQDRARERLEYLQTKFPNSMHIPSQ